MATNQNYDAEEIDAQIESEFFDEARDTLGTIDIALENVRSKKTSGAEALATLRRGVMSLRTQGRTVNLPLINLVTHQFDDYLSGLKELEGPAIDDAQAYVDKLHGIIEGDIDEASVDGGATLVRELPAKRIADIDFGDLTQSKIQVLAVVPEKAMSIILEKELAACGYRTTKVRNAFNAFEMAVKIKPDMIITSMELGDLSGVDLANAFSAMAKTRHIPFALLTSYSIGDRALDGLPPRAAVLRKGSTFGEDLAQALAHFKIT